MFVTLYLCESPCNKHFAVEGVYSDTSYCPTCPICESGDNVFEKSVATLAVMHELHQDED